MMASGKKSEWKTPRFLSPVSLEHPLESAEANDLFSFFFLIESEGESLHL